MNAEIAERFSVDHGTVRKWRNRLVADRLEGLSDAPRPHRPRTVSDAQVEEVIASHAG
jgi:transposase